jgi:hypothetical protein
MSIHVEPIPAEELEEHDEPRPRGRSLLDQIRADYKQDRSRRTLTLAIPGSHHLGVRYKALDPDDVPDPGDDEKIGDLLIDFLIAACDCLVMRAEKTDPWETVESQGMPVKFDGEAASLFDWPGKSAREFVHAAFSRVPMPEAAIRGHYAKLDEWLGTGNERLGE